MNSIELFAGAGGLAIGTARAGFSHLAVIEWDSDACDTLLQNKGRGIKPLDEWDIYRTDVRKFDFSSFSDVAAVIGGPPCQPFSLGGKHGGYNDERDMFPEAVRAVRETAPHAFVFENVRGLLRHSFAKYFEYIFLQLSHPTITRRKGEFWSDHLARLERHQTSGKRDSLSYNVVFRLLNAADFGVPQKRERVFLVGFRSDLDIAWSFPKPTHSQDALLYSKWVTGEYWDNHKISKRSRPTTPERYKSRIQSLSMDLLPPDGAPWLTVADALGDLPSPAEATRQGITNHVFNPGARSYPGHTGSSLHEPAKTLKAGDHGVPGGENMLALPDGSVRYFTVRESARLQTFDDDFSFPGSWTESMRQIGNAVPVKLAHAVAKSVAKQLRARLRVV